MSSNSQFSRKQKGGRQVRRKVEDVKYLSITSLLDVLTIILVFLIKNVSMEAVKISELPDMRYPTTISTDKLLENATVTPIKLYLNEVILGVENLTLGTPQQLVEDGETRAALQNFLTLDFAAIPEEKKSDACLIVQADANLPCGYITQIVSAGTTVGYENIYFATLEDVDWLRTYSSASVR